MLRLLSWRKKNMNLFNYRIRQAANFRFACVITFYNGFRLLQSWLLDHRAAGTFLKFPESETLSKNLSRAKYILLCILRKKGCVISRQYYKVSLPTPLACQQNPLASLLSIRHVDGLNTVCHRYVFDLTPCPSSS